MIDFSYYDYCTRNVSRRKIKDLRKELFEALQKDESKVRFGTCFKVTLPLINGHQCHVVDPQQYWEQRFRSIIGKRAEVLIKQGLCQTSILKDMLTSFIDNELFAEHELPKVSKIYLSFSLALKTSHM